MSNYRNIDIDRIAGLFKAISNPHRLRMFMKLATSCTERSCCDASDEGIRRCVGELAEDLGLAASTVSHHLKELRQAGLVRVERCGQKIECWVSEQALSALSDFFQTVHETRAEGAATKGSQPAGRRRR
jgi:ArsR family transcriptional regulator